MDGAEVPEVDAVDDAVWFGGVEEIATHHIDPHGPRPA
jgi:hypothetical protein